VDLGTEIRFGFLLKSIAIVTGDSQTKHLNQTAGNGMPLFHPGTTLNRLGDLVDETVATIKTTNEVEYRNSEDE